MLILRLWFVFNFIGALLPGGHFMPFFPGQVGWQALASGIESWSYRTELSGTTIWLGLWLTGWTFPAGGWQLVRRLNMKSLFTTFLVFPCLLCVTACGSNMMMTNTTNMSRQLQTITVTPASATAQSTSRQVQFTPMGSYTMAPMSAMPTVLWSVGDPFSAMPAAAGVTINQNGLASCSTFSGMVTIQATAPMNPSMSLMQMGMMTMNVAGAAQLTCP